MNTNEPINKYGKLLSQIVVNGQITDASGHTAFSGTIDEAMETIMEQVTKRGKWVYVNGNPFVFKNHSLMEQDELRGMLTNVEEPTFVLTAQLQGGVAAVEVNTKVVKEPIGKTSKGNHLGVSVNTRKGKPVINLVVSEANKAKLGKNRSAILGAVFRALAA
jgi:hypothetical protein